MRAELSPRELAVLEFAVRGFTDEMIASEVGITRGTVNSYWVRIRGKLGHFSRTELVARFVQARADANAGDLKALNEGLVNDNKLLLEAANLEIERLKALIAEQKRKG